MKGLETIAQSARRFVEAATETGIDGIFYAVQHAQASILSSDEFGRFSRLADLSILGAADSLWCNMLHIHGVDIYFDAVADYPVHILNWHDRDTAPSLAAARGSDVFKASQASVVCGGIGRDTLTYGTPAQVTLEATDAFQQTGGRGLIFSTGCVVPIIAPYGNLVAARDSASLR